MEWVGVQFGPLLWLGFGLVEHEYQIVLYNTTGLGLAGTRIRKHAVPAREKYGL